MLVKGIPEVKRGRVTHICVGKLTNIGSDNGLSPGRHQTIIWTNAGILLIGPLGTYFREILIEVYTFSFKKMHVKMSSGKWRPFCLGINLLTIEVPQMSFISETDSNHWLHMEYQLIDPLDEQLSKQFYWLRVEVALVKHHWTSIMIS